MIKKVPLICPSCQSELKRYSDHIECIKCTSLWKIIDDIPIFGNSEFYWGEIPYNDMREINLAAEKYGWQDALTNILEPNYPSLYRYITSSNRANCQFLLSINETSKIIDLGSGWGTISCIIAPICDKVVAIEGVYERGRFSSIRKRQEGYDNMEVIVSDAVNLPIPDSYFDVAILNGILEWVGLSAVNENPRLIQKRFLKNVSRILKPGGIVYIGIENRYGYSLLLGGKDHSGLRYTSLMPRWLADIYVKLRKPIYRTYMPNNGYKTYTYSMLGYKKLLEKAGFSDIRFYAPLPHYNEPKAFIELNNRQTLSHYLANKSSLLSKMAKNSFGCWIASFISSDFSIIASKQGEQNIDD